MKPHGQRSESGRNGDRTTLPGHLPGEGPGTSHMVKTSGCPYVSSKSDRPTGCKRSKAFSLCRKQVVRLQVSNVLVWNCRTTGVQGTPKSLIGSIMWNVLTQSHRLTQSQAGITVRRAVGVAGERIWKKQRPVCNGLDRAVGVAQRKNRRQQPRRKRADIQKVSHCERTWRTF